MRQVGSIAKEMHMSLISKWFLGRLGRLQPAPPHGPSDSRVALPPPDRVGGIPLMQALARRQSEREFDSSPMSAQQLSDMLWAANGINRPELREHTAPSA